MPRLPNQANVEDFFAQALHAMQQTNIMMPLDLLRSDKYLFIITPYCDGGEMFDRLCSSGPLAEPEARYWMQQLLNGLETLQRAGICHRDVSLENLMVHQSGALVIDFGMCLLVPFHVDEAEAENATAMQSMQQQLSQMQINRPVATMQQRMTGRSILPDARARRRLLIRPQGTCGKVHYMSPEIQTNSQPFDGYAVDMWSAGIILFFMLTGSPPWDLPSLTDQRFKWMTDGCMVDLLTEWQLGLSNNAMDLLQRMLWLDPTERLSLAQVRAHPWMDGPVELPLPTPPP